MFDDEIAKLISRSGGVGVADAALNEMLKAQELA
jgi:Rod binding domain-containing protein